MRIVTVSRDSSSRELTFFAPRFINTETSSVRLVISTSMKSLHSPSGHPALALLSLLDADSSRAASSGPGHPSSRPARCSLGILHCTVSYQRHSVLHSIHHVLVQYGHPLVSGLLNQLAEHPTEAQSRRDSLQLFAPHHTPVEKRPTHSVHSRLHTWNH